MRCKLNDKKSAEALSALIIAGPGQIDCFLAQFDVTQRLDVQKKFDGIMKRYKGDLKPSGQDAAWLVYAYAKLGHGLTIVSFEQLALIPPDLLKRLLRTPIDGVLIFYGRSPIPPLKGQGDNIKTTVLFGNSLNVMKTNDALKMTGPALREVLQLQQKASAAEEFDADLE